MKKRITNVKKGLVISSLGLLLVVSLYSPARYWRTKLEGAGFPPWLYDHQHRLSTFTIHGPLENLKWLSSNSLRSLEVSSPEYRQLDFSSNRLRELTLKRTRLTNLKNIEAQKDLTFLRLVDNMALTDLSALAELPNLETLVIESTGAPINLSALPLQQLQHVAHLKLNNVVLQRGLGDLMYLPQLKSLHLANINGVKELDLRRLSQLEDLTLKKTDLHSTELLPISLKNISLADNEALRNLNALSSFSDLTSLNLANNRQIGLIDIPQLASLNSLRLHLPGTIDNFTDLVPRLPLLRHLSLVDLHTGPTILGLDGWLLDEIELIKMNYLHTLNFLSRQELKGLHIHSCQSLSPRAFEAISSQTRLKVLTLIDSNAEYLDVSTLGNLEKLSIIDNPRLVYLGNLNAIPKLKRLSFSGLLASLSFARAGLLPPLKELRHQGHHHRDHGVKYFAYSLTLLTARHETMSNHASADSRILRELLAKRRILVALAHVLPYPAKLSICGKNFETMPKLPDSIVGLVFIFENGSLQEAHSGKKTKGITVSLGDEA